VRIAARARGPRCARPASCGRAPGPGSAPAERLAHGALQGPRPSARQLSAGARDRRGRPRPGRGGPLIAAAERDRTGRDDVHEGRDGHRRDGAFGDAPRLGYVSKELPAQRRCARFDARGEGYGAGVRAVFEAGSSLTGVRGTVADLREVSAGARRAGRRCSASALQWVVVDSFGTRGRRWSIWRRGRAARAKFVALEHLHNGGCAANPHSTHGEAIPVRRGREGDLGGRSQVSSTISGPGPVVAHRDAAEALGGATRGGYHVTPGGARCCRGRRSAAARRRRPTRAGRALACSRASASSASWTSGGATHRRRVEDRQVGGRPRPAELTTLRARLGPRHD